MPRFKKRGVEYENVADIPRDAWTNLEGFAFDASVVMSKAIDLIRAKLEEVLAELQRCVDMIEGPNNVINATKKAVQQKSQPAQNDVAVEQHTDPRQFANLTANQTHGVAGLVTASKSRKNRAGNDPSKGKKRKAREVDAPGRPTKLAKADSPPFDEAEQLNIPVEVFVFDEERFIEQNMAKCFPYQDRAHVEYSRSKAPAIKDVVVAAQAHFPAMLDLPMCQILTYQQMDSQGPGGYKKADAFLLRLYLSQQKKKRDDKASNDAPGYVKGSVGMSIIFTKNDLEKAHANTAAVKAPPQKPTSISDDPELQ